MSNFNPWTATADEAIAAQQHSQDSGPTGPIFQWSAAQDIMNRRDRVEKGDGFDVLQQVASCGLHGLVMPEWLAKAFLRRYLPVQQLKVGSWDAPEAFGRPHPKGAQLSAIRRRRLGRIKIVRLVNEFVRQHPDEPLDPHWDEFGRRISEGRTRVQELFAEAVKLGMSERPGAIRKRHGWPEVPAKFGKLAGRRNRR